MSSSATPSKMAAVARPCIAVARVVRACLALRASSVPSLYPAPHTWQTEQIAVARQQRACLNSFSKEKTGLFPLKHGSSLGCVTIPARAANHGLLGRPGAGCCVGGIVCVCACVCRAVCVAAGVW